MRPDGLWYDCRGTRCNDGVVPGVGGGRRGRQPRHFVCASLSSRAITRSGSKSGESAWTQLVSGLRPSVVIVDLALERMSGRELLGLLRATEWGRCIPVLLLSGWERVERFAEQADAVLNKNAEGVSITRTVDRLALRGRSTEARGAVSERRAPHRSGPVRTEDRAGPAPKVGHNSGAC